LASIQIWPVKFSLPQTKISIFFGTLSLLHLKHSTPNFMIYGELGRYPMEIKIKTRMMSYWSKLISGKETKIALLFY
jgi:hypothetical protein